VTGRRQAELDEAVRAIGPRAVGVQGDISSLKNLDRLYAQIDRKHGRLDLLFANAGGFGRLGEISEEQFWQRPRGVT
jgi:NAD(P)-dependent dehydrogenase (short-subunit alcohol dehydrogenase family)